MIWPALLLLAIIFVASSWFLYRQVSYLTKVIKTLDGGLSLSGNNYIPQSGFKESPNNIADPDSDEIIFSEENPLDLSKIKKIEIEGEGSVTWEFDKSIN